MDRIGQPIKVNELEKNHVKDHYGVILEHTNHDMVVLLDDGRFIRVYEGDPPF